MKTIDAKQCTVIALGRLGENEYTVVRFDVSAWLSEYPEAVIGLYNQRPGDTEAYPVAGITVDGGVATWTVTSAELTQTGEGKCELVAIAGEVVAKSAIFRTIVFDALDGSGEAPEPWEEWQQQLIILKNDAEQAADRAEEAVEHYPRIVDGVWEVWDAQAGVYVSTGVQALGVNGVSPTITVAPISGGHRITITDANGTHTADVLDGAKGDTGRGIVSVQKTGTAGLVDTYTITYTDSTTSTFTVTNGQDGTPGADGTTFTPAVSVEGVISWTNDGGKTNPQPVNIKGPQGDDGTSPTVSVADITGGHRVTVTDADGTRTFDVMDGTDGRGIVSIAKTATSGLVDTYTITYTANPTSTFTVINGKDGDEGYSPTIAVAEITGGHRVTVTNKSGSSYFDVLDGQPGQPGPGVPAGGTTGQMLVKKSDTDYDGEWANQPSVPVQDVQVNGASILNNGVANVPIGSSSNLGVVKSEGGYGIFINNTYGRLYIDKAGSNHIKAETDQFRPIVPYNQHESTFYGLAKAAGADMASSPNPVGTYTDAAKVAIQKMLGIYEAPWELIREDTVTNATEADIEITVDGNGNPFELTDAIIQLIMDDANTPSATGGNGDIRFVYGAGSNDYKRFFVGAMNHSAGATAIATMARITTTGGLLYGDFATVGNVSSSSNLKTQQYYQLAGNRQMIELVDSPVFFNQIIVKAITGPVRYVLYGKRKWQ